MDPKVQEEKTRLANEREFAQFEKSQRRLGELVIFFCYLDKKQSAVQVLNPPSDSRQLYIAYYYILDTRP